MAATNKTRTVVYLDPEDREFLDRMSKITGASVGELVRRAVSRDVKQLRRKTKPLERLFKEESQ